MVVWLKLLPIAHHFYSDEPLAFSRTCTSDSVHIYTCSIFVLYLFYIRLTPVVSEKLF